MRDAVAIDHPYRMTGSRMAGTLDDEMAPRNDRYGTAKICVCGAQSGAAMFERVT
jgi:acetyl-CoA acetyltransferase